MDKFETGESIGLTGGLLNIFVNILSFPLVMFIGFIKIENSLLQYIPFALNSLLWGGLITLIIRSKL